jgi:Rrf2 family protein
VRISAKSDYAIRAAAELAVAAPGVVKGEQIAGTQGIPAKFLENILSELRHAGIVVSHRGPEGGYSLARPPAEVTLADVIRAVDGPLANVRGVRPEQTEYAGSAAVLREVWIALRGNIRAVLEAVTLADLAAGALPGEVRTLAADPDAWQSR